MNIKCFLVERLSNEEDHWRRPDTGETFSRFNDIPVGAMYFATWLDIEGTDPKRYGYGWDNQFTPPLIVKTPGGFWNIDSRASNCTMTADNVHRCWIRHGEAPNITVDKNGHTCQAGAGSIQCGSYHGFLRNGELTDC